MLLLLLLGTTLLSNGLAIPVPSSCVDSATDTFVNDNAVEVGCSWLTDDPIEEANRVADYCPRPSIKYMCADTCDTCGDECEDNPAYVFRQLNSFLNVTVFRNCSWITEVPSQIDTRRESYCDGVGNFCPDTCGYCRQELTATSLSSPPPHPSMISSDQTSRASPSILMPSEQTIESPPSAPSSASRSSCTDSTSHMFRIDFNGGKLVHCDWLTKNLKQRATRTAKYCPRPNVRYMCAESCSTCEEECTDVPTYVFAMKNFPDKYQDCAWIVTTPRSTETRRKRYCNDVGAFCPEACGFCPTNMPMPPSQPTGISMRPTVRPTVSPTKLTNGGDDWTFLVMSDIHDFTDFSWANLEENKKTNQWYQISNIMKKIKRSYGGELVILPGDQVSYGKVSLQTFVDNLSDRGGNQLSPQTAIYKGARYCYKSMLALFEEVGYDTVLPTVGDHEIGGDKGFGTTGKRLSKVVTIPSHRLGFRDGVNRNDNGNFRFDESLDDGVASRPLGTPYENTSYAYVHRNALFITVDAFQTIGDGSKEYIDRENGLGGEGTVTCTVSGRHLTWFEKILRYGRDNPDIDHMFVQAHLPIIQPVRKVECSGQFFDEAEESDFWNLMNKYGVDIYFAGDVHAITATKSSHKGSDLIQIVSRARHFTNFLTLDLSKDIIDVTVYNEYGDKPAYNAKYESSGHLQIDKSSGNTEISSSGMLELLDTKSEIISFDFDEVHPLGTRQVISMNDEEHLMARQVTIRDKVCTDSMFNKGGFGAQHDAQLCGITLVNGRKNGGHAGYFGENSRFGMYGTGPFSGGEIVSFGLWIKTRQTSRRMVLFHYGDYWGKVVKRKDWKDHFMLTLDYGVPVVNTQTVIQLRPLDENINLADGSWHHIAISMPRKSCRVSELKMYVDGEYVEAKVVNEDRHIFCTTAGRANLGSFGYSTRGFEDAYPDVSPFVGIMDDFVMFARPLKMATDFP